MSGQDGSGTGAFNAFWLPGLPHDVPLRTLRAGSLQCRYPEPTPSLLSGAIERLREVGPRLRERPASEIVTAIDAVAARLADPDDPFRREAHARLGEATGYSDSMTSLVLDRMSAHWRRDALDELLQRELGGPAVLDGFAAAGPSATRAYGPDLAFHVFAGNVPGVAVTSMVRALLVKTPSIAKLASRQPVLPILFARGLADADPELGGALALTYWPGGSADGEAAEATALEAADLTVVYGGPDAASSFEARVPRHRRLVLHGPRFSVGLIGRDAVTDSDLADQVATAVGTFDQHGCVSPHALWVEGGHQEQGEDSPRSFAARLAKALQHVEERLPRGEVSAAEAATIQQERGAAEMRAHDHGVEVFAGKGTRWTVVYDPDPAFRPSCLNRFVRVHPVATLEEVPERLRRIGRHLQSVALACDEPRRTRLAHDLARAGATRITTFPRLPWPPPGWHHDGQSPLRELLHWVDLER